MWCSPWGCKESDTTERLSTRPHDKTKQSASEVRVFHIFLDYSFLLTVLTTQPTKLLLDRFFLI